MMDLVVPLRWSGRPYTEGSFPSAWLGSDGTEVASAADALRVQFRTQTTMADLFAIDEAMAAIFGGARAVAELELAASSLWATLVRRYEAKHWPDGRPKAETREEALEQEMVLELEYVNEGPDRLVLEQLRTKQQWLRVAAEWRVLIVDPPAGWADLATRLLESSMLAEVVSAYLAAKDKHPATLGKEQRSEP